MGAPLLTADDCVRQTGTGLERGGGSGVRTASAESARHLSPDPSFRKLLKVTDFLTDIEEKHPALRARRARLRGMLHRSLGGPALGAATLSLILALAFAPAARAADDGRPADVKVPADAPTVAGPTAAGASLIAWVQGKDLCVAVQRAGEPRPATLRDPTDLGTIGGCGETEVLPAFGARSLGTLDLDETGEANGTSVSFGVAGPDAAAVEARLGTTPVVHAATTSSPLAGAAADLRFWIFDQARTARADELAVLDAAGVVRRASELDGSGLDDAEDELDTGGTVVQRGQHGTTRWTLRLKRLRSLSPTPLEPERRVTNQCLVFATATARGGSGTSTSCDDEQLAALPVVLDTGTDCGIGPHVAVLARPAVRRVVVVLGDGHRAAVPLSDTADGVRAGALVLGTGVAIRRVVVLGAGGRALTTYPLGLAPEPRRRRCPGLLSTSSGFFTINAPQPLGAAPHTLQAVDHGALLCVAVDRAPRVPADCRLPPIAADDGLLSADPTADGRFVSGLVPAEVTTARLKLDDGTQRTVATEPIPGYAGRYAAVVRAVAVDVPGPHRVVGFALLDGRGRVLRQGDDQPEAPATGRPVTLLRVPGVPPLSAMSVPLSSPGGGFTCLGLGTLRSSADCDASGGGQFGGGVTSLRVRATCDTRRILVLGILRRHTDRLVVRTASGREVVARRARIPAAAGAAAGGYAALAVVGARDGVREIVLRGRAANRVALPLPPAAQQCGYEASPAFDDAFRG